MSRTAYKYRRWDEYTKRIITHQELYFADPKEFNDIFDCQACGIIKDYNPPCAPFSIIEKGNIRFYNNIDPIKLLNEVTKQNISKCGVCCFSKTYNSILMWSHYAHYNRGVCFRFDLDEINLTNGLFDDVKYVRSKPIFDFNDLDEDLSKWFFYKYKVWKYEREIRGLIFPPQNAEDEQYRKLQFPREALKEIIFGANIAKQTFEEIIGLCGCYGFHNIKFSFIQATTNTDVYKLVKVPLRVKI